MKFEEEQKEEKASKNREELKRRKKLKAEKLNIQREEFWENALREERIKV